MDADGSTVSFLFTADNLVPGDTNRSTDVFVRDIDTGTTTRWSVASNGGQAGSGVDSSSALSGDGRKVSFSSRSSDLSPGDTNGLADVFVHDVVGGTTRVSVADAGQASAASSDPVLTHDGHMVGFVSSASNLVREDTNRVDDIFVAPAEADAGASSVSVGGLAASVEPSVSGDGRFVAFSSRSANLVPGDSNGFGDVFVRDRTAPFDHTTRVSEPEGPAQAVGHSYSPAISADGRFVAFVSEARNLVPGDTNGVADVFVYDRDTAATTRASVKGAGKQANGPSGQPSISADGRQLAFTSWAANVTSGDTNGVADVFVRDLTAGATQRVSVSQATVQGGRTSDSPSISGDGTVVAFRSDAKNLVAGDTNGVGDVFVRNLVALTTTRVSVASDGTEATGPSSSPAVSAGAGIVAFGSKATNLVSGDTNGVADAFVHVLASGATERVSVSSGGKQGNGASSPPAVSADGKKVAFVSKATNLVPGDTNRAADIFVRRW